jgi:hypothetical protein
MWDNINAWWLAMSGFEHAFWYMAIPASIFGLLSVGSSMLGLHHDGSFHDGNFSSDHSFDHNDSGESHYQDNDQSGLLSVITLKNLIMFFAGTGWMGIIGVRADWPKTLTVLIAILIGFAFATLFVLVFRALARLGESGNITSYESAKGQLATTYLPIPAKRAGVGQVQVAVAGRIREIDAITDDDETLTTDTKVLVTDIYTNDILVVTKKLTVS